MKRTLLFCCCLLLLCLHGHAQSFQNIPFDFKSEDDNRFLNENDSIKFYVASWDTSNTVGIDDDASLYRLYNSDGRKIAEGAFVMSGDKYLQDGKWTAWFNSGKLKISGTYMKGKPVGTWESYHSSGKVRAIYNYAIFNDQKDPQVSCISGTYLEYYSNGNLKSSGFYESVLSEGTDTIIVADPVDGHDVEKVLHHSDLIPRKTGHWEYYNENGALERKEDL